jgi:hypothetical protein
MSLFCIIRFGDMKMSEKICEKNQAGNDGASDISSALGKIKEKKEVN